MAQPTAPRERRSPLAALRARLHAFSAGRSPALDDETTGRIRAAQIGSITRYSGAVMVANVVNGAVLMASLANSEHAALGCMWGFVLVAYSCFVYLRRRNYATLPPARMVSIRAVRHAMANAAFLGTLWGVVPVLFFDQSASGQLVIVSLVVGMMCGGCFVLATIPSVAAVYLLPLAIGSAIALLRSADYIHLLIILLMFSYVGILVAASVAHALQFRQRVLGQLDAERQARLDALTGLPNRLAFTDTLAATIKRCRNYGEGFAVFSLDLDAFKSINDRFGHLIGDQILVEVARRTSQGLCDGDLIARMGGDEFAILLRGVQAPADAAEIAERLLSLFSIPVVVGEESFATRISIGIAIAPTDGLDVTTLLEAADVALYKMKREGRSGFRFFEPQSNIAVQYRKTLGRDIRTALPRGQLKLALQPIIQIAKGRTCCYQALLRWEHPECGTIEPEEFVPLAEKSGAIHEIGHWAIDEACRIAASLGPDASVALNVSLEQFRGKAMVPGTLEALRKHGLAPSRLQIEINEAVLFHEEPEIRDTIGALSAAGLHIVLGDFGMGWSSLRNLQNIRVDSVKIDRCFVAALPQGARSVAIVKAMLDLCHALNMTATANGVETPEQYALLAELGCDSVMGPLLAAPRLASDIPAPTPDAERLVA